MVKLEVDSPSHGAGEMEATSLTRSQVIYSLCQAKKVERRRRVFGAFFVASFQKILRLGGDVPLVLVFLLGEWEGVFRSDLGDWKWKPSIFGPYMPMLAL
ncbi:unnamed protein product [Prunus armeniaca]|uniref:Uncharacterized protein n=1 Tax=Prunus armeniaca TaxID=36596 RepID=A0A6J5UYF4_PRUAR|nr:unnamed protein product [Prunus armeniaca]CAB4309323.1 unnamed protein product [Prunus armeniaca]